jgi:CelD/BcsL family acetyltransferase involved in cellulose biosynthesis
VSGLIVKHLDSLAELRRAAPAWDELWQRSEITLPTARADLIALWCECFAAGQPFRATVVEESGQLVAALPLVGRKLMGMKVGVLPGNHWSSAGDLLLDPHADTERVCGALLGALQERSPAWLWFDAVPAQTNRWQTFLRAVEQRQLAYVRRRRFTIDLVRIGSDGKEYFDSRSRSQRRHVRRAASRAQRGGPTELRCHECLTPQRVEELLTTCFEIEASGWKGQAQSAMLHSPGACAFYLRQAHQLAAWGQLSLNLLWHQARPIAFEYGWQSKGVYGSAKVGYDETFAPLSPGQLLRYFLIEQFHSQSDVQWVDFLGPSSDATSKWATHEYPVERIALSQGTARSLEGMVGRALFAAYRHGWPLVCGIRGAAARIAGRAAIAQHAPAPSLPDCGEVACDPAAVSQA